MRIRRSIPWAVIIASLHSAALAQIDDPISSGSFQFERRAGCVSVSRQSGTVFSGPRGYLVENREIEADGDGDRLWVEERFVLRNRGKSCPMERCAGAACGQVQVRLPIPPRAGFGEACMRIEGAKRCEPVSHHRDARSTQTVVLSIPMLDPDDSRTVIARYVVPAVPLRGAGSWLSATLPPRGLDERAVDKVVVVATVGDRKTREVRDAGLSVDLQVASSLSADPLLRDDQRTTLILDRSPSMDGPAGGRVARLVAALLDQASPEKKVRFGYLRGGLILDPAYMPVQALGSLRSLLRPEAPPPNWLQATTSISSLDNVFDAQVQRGDQVVVVGDGALHLDRGARAFFERSRTRRLRVDLINLDPRAVDPELRRLVHCTGGSVREIGLRWELVPRHLLDSYVRGALHHNPGAARRSNGVARRSRSLRGWKRTAVADLAAQARTLQHTPAGLGVPAESALRLLREQLVPAARSCLRGERRGRTAHSRRATFEFEITRQEIEGLRVKGVLPESLRACLYDAAARLVIPRFEGRVRVRYPLYTEVLKGKPTVELRPETRALLDELIGGP